MHQHLHYRDLRRRREKEPEKEYQELIDKSFHKMGNTHSSSGSIESLIYDKPKKNPQRNIKLVKIKDKEKILTATKEK